MPNQTMSNYYFTFGQSHAIDEVFNMKDYWVRVHATDYAQARQIFIERFALPVMGKADRWSWQYTGIEFQPRFFPKGEFLLLKQNEQTTN